VSVPRPQPAPTTEEEVFQCIFDYIDRLFAMVRPRKLVYMAIDGVAPRAKMNQQRSRRFRAAQEATEKEEEDEKLRAKLRAEGVKVPERVKSEAFDSNVITPGTPFMGRLSAALQYYVHLRMNTDPAWRGVKVIMSDASVPGEGEHKAMHYIRQQRGQKGFDPNTKHVVYGLDADLIMLGLATHEPQFWILREVVFQKNQPVDTAPSARDQLLGNVPKEAKPSIARKPYQLLSVAVLREYLALDLQPSAADGRGRADLPFDLDIERLFDDFIFMCFFVGNDFLPHSPTLEIREGAIDLIMTIYRQELAGLGGYLCGDGKPNLGRVEKFVAAVGQHEEAIFQKRSRTESRQRQRRARDKQMGKQPCHQFTRGQCQRGDSCKFSHETNAGKRMGGSINASDRAPPMAPAELRALGRGVPPPWPPPARPPPGAPPPSGAPPPPGEANRSAADNLRAALLGKAAAVPPPAPPAPVDNPGAGKSAAQNKSAAEALRAKLLGGGKGGKGKRAAPDPDAEEAAEDGGAKRSKEDVAPTKQKETPADPAAFWNELVAVPQPEETKKDAKGKGKKAASAGAGAGAAAAAADAEGGVEFKDEMAADAFLKQLEAVMKDKGDRIDEMDNDPVRLGEQGWKGRYYGAKMHATEETADAVVRGMVEEYVRGLTWVCRYYYEGCCSWNWYYPFHYAPFATDLVNLESINMSFDLGEPFRPFEQLMGVLPAASAHALPPAFHPLMMDEDSPIIDFYPTQFDLDMNGKRFAWQAVALLPWIDETRLLAETRSLDSTLTGEETRRNTINLETLLVHVSHGLSREIYELEDDVGADTRGAARFETTKFMTAAASGCMNGEMVLVGGETCPTRMPTPMKCMADIENNQVLAVCFKLPGPLERFVPPVLMPGAMLPDPVVGERDMPPPPKLWHEDAPRGPHQSREMPHPSRPQGGQPMGLGGGGGGGGPLSGLGMGMGMGPMGGGGNGPGLSAGAHRLLQASVQAGGRGGVMSYAPAGGGMPAGGGGYPQQQQQQQQQQQFGGQGQMGRPGQMMYGSQGGYPPQGQGGYAPPPGAPMMMQGGGGMVPMGQQQQQQQQQQQFGGQFFGGQFPPGPGSGPPRGGRGGGRGGHSGANSFASLGNLPQR